MTMVAKVFLDTNIVLRVIFLERDAYPQIHAKFEHLIESQSELWISGQVIRELLVQATHPKTFETHISIYEAIQKFNQFKRLLRIADDTNSVREMLLELIQMYPTQGKKIHDANIVATMLAYQIDTLFTLNIDDFRRFENKITLLSL